MALKQEHEELHALENEDLSSLPTSWNKEVWDIITRSWDFSHLNENRILSLLSKAPEWIWLNETVNWYIENFKDYWIFEDMKSKRSPYEYMAWKHQKTFTKAYFVPLLEKIFHFCDKKWYKDLAQAMFYNYRDEKWERLDSTLWNEYDKESYEYPEASEWEEYKIEPHENWREYEYNWLKREYSTVWKKKNLPWRNAGTQIFNTITWWLLSWDDERVNFERIWAVMFLEKFIPFEFEHMRVSRDKNFPWLSAREKHYINDHIEHDAEFHFEDILNGIKTMQLNDDQKKMIVDWMHKIYMWREFMYSAFAKQMNSWMVQRIIRLPIFKKMKYWVAASLLIISGLFLDNFENNWTDISMWIYDIDDIELYEKEVATKMWVWDEYSSWASTDFAMIDYVWYEAMRKAILDQKWKDIWSYH